ncbi:MAG: hypothetical protein PHO66_05660 [Eubacteriales bacterium]|nr:hypothetical protein [Eubacteriales bacterium]
MRLKMCCLLLCLLLLSGCAGYPRNVRVEIRPTPAPTGSVEQAVGYKTSRIYSRLVAGIAQTPGDQRDVVVWQSGDTLLCVNRPVRLSDALPTGDTLYTVNFMYGFSEPLSWSPALSQRKFEVYDVCDDGDKLLLICYNDDKTLTLTLVSLGAQTAGDIVTLQDAAQLLAYGWSPNGTYFGVITQSAGQAPALQVATLGSGARNSYDLGFLKQALGSDQPYYMARGNMLVVGDDGDTLYLLLKNGKYAKAHLADRQAQTLWTFGKSLPHALQLLQDDSLVYSDSQGVWWAHKDGQEPYSVAAGADLFRVSPDEKQVAYMSQIAGGTRDLYVGVLYRNKVYERYRVYNDLSAAFNHMRWSGDAQKLLVAYHSKGPKNDTPQEDQPYAVFDFS